MAGRRKLIVVSNRGPVVYDRTEGGERIARRGGGGLVTALRSLVEPAGQLADVRDLAGSDRVRGEQPLPGKPPKLKKQKDKQPANGSAAVVSPEEASHA